MSTPRNRPTSRLPSSEPSRFRRKQCLDAEFEHDWVLTAILAAANRRARPRTLAAPTTAAGSRIRQTFEQIRRLPRASTNASSPRTIRVIKRISTVDSLAYRRGRRVAEADQGTARPGRLARPAMRLRDGVRLVDWPPAAYSRKEIVEAMIIGLVVGGTIVIPHLRRAVEFLDDLEAPQSSSAKNRGHSPFPAIARPRQMLEKENVPIFADLRLWHRDARGYGGGATCRASRVVPPPPARDYRRRRDRCALGACRDQIQDSWRKSPHVVNDVSVGDTPSA